MSIQIWLKPVQTSSDRTKTCISTKVTEDIFFPKQSRWRASVFQNKTKTQKEEVYCSKVSNEKALRKYKSLLEPLFRFVSMNSEAEFEDNMWEKRTKRYNKEWNYKNWSVREMCYFLTLGLNCKVK